MDRPRLKSATIVPPELYVERAADKQLSRIVEDMGRPAYVLVARQMGKTNLLINMKREREALGEAVVYIDLSNRFSSARSCLRHIIDIALDTISALERAEGRVLALREKSLSAASEYERSLRILLSEFSGDRFIIVLDEVDSLAASDFSDRVFALVRSMYFSRVNYPEFNRVTYVLSGVADPIDLIKDKSISPFNIGDKVFLSDFTREQFFTFTKRAGLNLPKPTLDRVFYWARGNPRLTWDICAAIEPLAMSASARPSDVDHAVDKLYLQRFDIPPIDHIRDLVKSDPQLASAIMSIRYGKGDSLSDKLKAKLYLAGVTESADRETVIKNKIVDEALSEPWLSQVQAQVEDPISLAFASYASSEWPRTVALFDEYYRGHPQLHMPTDVKIALGISLYHLGEFPRSVEILTSISDSSEPVSGAVSFHVGSSYLHLKRPAESRPFFEKTCILGPEQFRLAAKILLATSLLEEGGERHEAQILQLIQQTIDEISSPGTSGSAMESYGEVLTAAYYNLAWVHELCGRRNQALDAIALAISSAQPRNAVEPLLFKAKLYSRPSEACDTLREAVDLILKEGLSPANDHTNSLSFKQTTVADLGALLARANQSADLERLVSYLATVYVSTTSHFEVLLRLFTTSEGEGKGQASVDLLRRAVSSHAAPSVSDKDYLTAWRFLVKYESDARHDGVFDRYLLELEGRMRSDVVTDDDFTLLIGEVNSLMATGRLERALRLTRTIRRASEIQSESSSILLVAATYFEMSIHNTRGNFELAKEAAFRLLDGFKRASTAESSGDDLSFLSHMQQQAVRVIKFVPPDPFRTLQRNNRVVVKDVATGIIMETKFKYVEERLRSGDLVLVPTDVAGAKGPDSARP